MFFNNFEVKKILLLISGDPVGGIRKHVHAIINEAIIKGYTIHYIHSKNYDSVANQDFKNLDILGCHRMSLVINKLPGLRDLINITKIILYCKTNNILLVHGHGAKGGIYARCVSIFSSVKSIYTPHGGVFHDCFSKIFSLIFLQVESVLKRVTSFYIFESNYTKYQFDKKIGLPPVQSFKVIPNGVDESIFKTNKKWNYLQDIKVNILAVGMLRKIKGHAVLIDAISLVIKQGYNVILNICGDGVEIEDLRKQAKNLSIDKQVRFHGDVVNIQQYYEDANIVIIPSFFESFGYVAVEAALMKRPVIASNVGGLMEIITNNETGILFPAGDGELLARSIIRIISDQDKTSEMVLKSYNKCINVYSQRVMLSRIFDIYSTFSNQIIK
jgi:glycosyltransferase involved in cell wall biosynthesis